MMIPLSMKTKEQDFMDGVKYGFPICCILWFLGRSDSFVPEYFEEYRPRTHAQADFVTGYVRCPECQVKAIEAL